jgi:AbrB family looped-hinge helix DNA binding protein
MIGSITSKGQTTVPKEVRDRLGLEQGARIEWVIDGDKAIVKPRKLRAVDLAGILGPPPSGKSLAIEEFDDAIMQAVAEDWDEFERQEREDPA